MNTARLAGFAVGLMVSLIVIVVIFKSANRDHRMKTEYDERQLKIRGKAYQYAFYTLALYEVIMTGIDLGRVELPIERPVLHFASIVISGLVLAAYCVCHDVYWGLNNDKRRYAIIFALLAVCNVIPVAGALKSGTMMMDGRLSTPFINVMVLIMMAVLAVMLLIKQAEDGRIDESEDE